jgi:flagellar biosynthesis anti-sigma factor FlgM
MEIRNSLDHLKSLIDVTVPATLATQANAAIASGPSALSSESAALSSAGSAASLTAADSDVRMDKVEAIRTALASGSYNVPAPAVASKLVDAMMSVRQ